MDTLPRIGDRIADKSAPPDDDMIRDWLGPRAHAHWVAVREWIDAAYPGVFEPEWLHGGRKRGWALRYRKTRALCALLPAYGRLEAEVVLGRAERAMFEERRYTWRPQLVERYDEAPSYPDGKWLTVPVSSADERQDLIDLLAMKRPPRAP
ncbi:DUF3788 domain-containing protein [Burkholderia gladioli]|uniref:DUF3788 domain-containing protein n=1 Tax=Burkholderia gladioli TaxID=28095 RepID=UPI001640FE4D|nr:DUF3788 domain-containing protein [Burkholderia gladioli]